MKYITEIFAKTLPTPRLLAYYKKLRTQQFYVSDHVWDCSCSECYKIKERIINLHQQMKMIKSILDTREHVKS